MLGRRVTGNSSFICMRCRLQQRIQLSAAGATKRPPFSFPSYTALSSFSTRASSFSISPLSVSRGFRRHFGTEPAAAPEPEPEPESTEPRPEPELHPTVHGREFDPYFDVDTDPRADSFQRRYMDSEEFKAAFEQDTEALTNPLRRDPARPRVPRWWKNRNMLVTTTEEEIPVDILGSPGSTLVIRELEKRRKAVPLPELTPKDPLKVSLEDLMAEVDSNNRATVEEYIVNINELQPQESRLITTKEFLELKDALVKGFTTPQLHSYMKQWERAQRIKGPEKSRTDRPWMVERRQWVPIIENAVETDEPALYGYILPGMTPKERSAIRVMRVCWDLSVREVAANQGYLDVRFRDVEFSLLTLGSQIWLKLIARRYLKPGKQIELYRQSNFVSIMAPMHTAYLILETINVFLDNTVTERFPIGLISPSPISLGRGVLNRLGLMTSSVVRVDPTGREITVTWIEMPDRVRKTEVETPGEMVLRLLTYAYRTKPRNSYSLVMVAEDAEGRYLSEADCESKLAWQERFSKWARWTSSLPLSNSPHPSTAVRGPPEGGQIPAGILPLPLQSNADPLALSGDSNNLWSPEPITETSAAFGRVLFSHEGVTSPLANPEVLPAPNSHLSRTFTPILPAVRAMCFRTNLYEEGLWHTIVVMRLVPAPDLPKEIVASAPELEIRLEADHSEIIRIISLRAITKIWTGDVLFPKSHVDVRLTQTQFYELQGKDVVDENAQEIIRFLKDSDLRPWEGHIATPPSAEDVLIPLKFLNPQPKVDSIIKDGDDRLVKIDYVFGGLEIRRTITAEHEGMKMRYTNYEGGHRRGRRSELSIEPVRVDPSTLKNGVPVMDKEKEPEVQAKILETLYKKKLPMASNLNIDVTIDALEVDDDETRWMTGSSAATAGIPGGDDAVDSEAIANKPDIDEPVTEEEFLHTVSKIATGRTSMFWFGKYKRTP
ncbi:mitochondrial inner-membrane-bound regulator-domain-containing protein [Podospora fimiseda]|uniref:Mitochondrial inner-membrane-bound regulator-domain-containing protein n=1 Tax=Podospora fimiseda TaxID=252190 RepID=A0AAN7C0K1_9PEZI|nr:mitochondrial inner-membrane-bound regulator-domain-containing protein [Podospora fimiseda]